MLPEYLKSPTLYSEISLEYSAAEQIIITPTARAEQMRKNQVLVSYKKKQQTCNGLLSDPQCPRQEH